MLGNKSKMRNSLLIYILLILVNTNIGRAQNAKIDSLRKLLANTADTGKAKILSDLCWEFRNISSDSALMYGNRAVQTSRVLKQKKQLSQALNDLGIIYNDQSKFEKALAYYRESLIIRKEDKDSMGIASLYIKIGIAYQKMGKLEEALQNQLISLQLYEQLKFNKGISYCLNNIAIVHYNMGNIPKALEYHLKSLTIKEEMNDDYGISGSLLNIANIYFEQKDFQKAIEYLNRALSIGRRINDKEYLSAILNNLGSALSAIGENNKALPLIQESIDLRQQMNDSKGLISSYVNLANVSYNLKLNRQSKEAFEKALVLSKQTSALPEQENLYKSMAEIAHKSGQLSESIGYYKQYMLIHDSLLNINLNKAVAEMSAKYESDKKEIANQLLKSENETKSLQLSKERVNRNILITLIVLILIAIIVTLNIISNRNKMKINRTMLEQERLWLNKVMQTQELERKRISRELHDGVGQMMAVVKMNVSAIQVHENFATQHQKSLQLIDQSCEELRQISHQLMPGVLIKGGLKAAFNELSYYMNHSGDIRFYFDINGFESRPSELVEINLYRIVQELLNNIVKYANATEVQVQVTREDETISVMIEDNGKGFDKDKLEKSTGNGWYNINSRLSLLKGSIEIDSKPGKGTVVFIEIEENKI